MSAFNDINNTQLKNKQAVHWLCSHLLRVVLLYSSDQCHTVPEPSLSCSKHSIRRLFLYSAMTLLCINHLVRQLLAQKTMGNKSSYHISIIVSSLPSLFRSTETKILRVWKSGTRTWRCLSLDSESDVPSISLDTMGSNKADFYGGSPHRERPTKEPLPDSLILGLLLSSKSSLYVYKCLIHVLQRYVSTCLLMNIVLSLALNSPDLIFYFALGRRIKLIQPYVKNHERQNSENPST
jgi:hypothetical protein